MGESVVISSRIRLARNLREYPFPCRLDEQGRLEVLEKIKKAVEGLSEEFIFVNMEDLPEYGAVSMVERHLISPEFAKPLAGRALAVSKDESISIMINEEDHLRIQVIKSGAALKEAYEIADKIDRELDAALSFAYDKKLGYLTQCPTNLGTGMRASFMMHLCALSESRTVQRIATNLTKLGFVIRGTYGEGSEYSGALYQISNQITLGISEESAIDNLMSICEQLSNSELQTREKLMESMEYQDRLSRSMGILMTARLISHQEAMRLLSNVRVGICEGIIEDISLNTIDKLMIIIQPASLMSIEGKKLTPQERDIARAKLIKNSLR
ncbi:MAG: protein arginine kinase [Ruminococcus sp.]|nr:protein arginine kinase [Oscillospiraceae bacterium]MBR2724271.1 protein arginine kinase [Ruminococcus sp.]